MIARRVASARSFKLERTELIRGSWQSVLVSLSSIHLHGLARKDEQSDDDAYEVAVIGGGVVGLATARACAAAGRRVILLEQEDALAAGASGGNSGLTCTGYDALGGSLEQKLLRRSLQLMPGLLVSLGLRLDEHFRKTGALVVAWTPEQLEQLGQVLEDNRAAGDVDARVLSVEELRKFEPELSHDALGAVFCPHEMVVEPWLITMGYAESARRFGAQIYTSTKVKATAYNESTQKWTLEIEKSNQASSCRSLPNEDLLTVDNAQARYSQPCGFNQIPNLIRTQTVINCAGLYGDDVERLEVSGAKRPEDFNIIPRKGEFAVFKLPRRATGSLTRIIEPVPTHFTKGVIAWETVYGNLIVGPTATDQISKTDRTTKKETMQDFQTWISRILPGAFGEKTNMRAKFVGSYAGLRPSTEHRDFQIRISNVKPKWVTVAGIRSTGLTASPAIGEYVNELVDAVLTKSAHSPMQSSLSTVTNFGHYPLLDVSTAVDTPVQQVLQQLQPLPSLADLARQFQLRGDGCLELYGRVHRVTHPVASFGLEQLE